ncbi:MAG: 30S ribosomal protein S20 [Lachnospiraceae bacterium]|nr:30S ribosomal protein S20 [Eubacterium sp.]MBQ5474652.1 30S ribosomal protein S20 [Lachnospiraceae bacterium]
MANIKSAKKRILVSKKKEMRNKAVKTELKTLVKKVDAAIAEGNKEAAATALLAATSKIDKAAKKGILHKNTAARKISRLNKAVNKIA